MSKVFIFGVDGGSYHLLHKFIKQGYLPNYEKLIHNGAFGKFISTIPPHTAPGWTSIATGVHPGTHGVYQFWKTQGEDYIGRYQGSMDWKTQPLWKLLNEYNLKTGIVNVPMTHPPVELDGFMISWPLSKTLNYSYPKTLLNEIAKEGGHFYPDIYIMYSGQEGYLKEACEITRKRVKTIQYLVKNKEWDLFMAVFPEIDRICHFYWHFMDEDSPYYIENELLKNAILKIYMEVDAAMGEILQILPEDILFVSLSDHGFRVGTVNFNINTFLLKNGYLNLKESSENKGEVNTLDDYMHSDWFHAKYEGKNYEVDWNSTKMFIAAPGSYGVNFNLNGRQKHGIVKAEEKQNLFLQFRDEILQVKHPYKDVPLFKKVVMREHVYKGKSQKLAPDIILIPDDYSIMVSHNLSIKELFSEPEQKGMHCMDGYILFYGNGVETGKELKESEVVDFVPTILEYFGVDIPKYIEGKSITPFTLDFKKQIRIRSKGKKIISTNSKHEERSYSDNEREEIEQRLKSLGYL